MQNVQIEELSKEYYENCEAEKSSRFSSYIIIIQNILCVTYGVAILAMVLTSILFISPPTNFFDLMSKMCLIPAVLMPAGYAGVLKKLTVNEFFSGDYNKKLTEFLYQSTRVVLIVVLISCAFAFWMDTDIKKEIIILGIVVGSLLFSFIFSRLKKYNKSDAKFLNLFQGTSFFALLGAAAVLVIPCITYISEDLINHILDLDLDILSGDIKPIHFFFSIFVLSALVGMVRNIYRVTCLCYSEKGDFFGIWVSVINFASGAITLIIAIICDLLDVAPFYEYFYLPISIMLVGSLLFFGSEIFFLISDKKKYFSMSNAYKKDIITGKTIGYPQIVSVDFYKIKVQRWNWEWALGFFALLTVMHTALDILCSYLMTKTVDVMENNLGSILNSVIESGFAASTVDVAEMQLSNHETLMMLIGWITAIVLAVFVIAVVNINGYSEIKRQKNLFESEKTHWSMWMYLPFVAVPMLMCLLMFFVEHHMKMMIFIFIIEIVYVLIYYHFGIFLFSKIKCPKFVSVLGPTFMFLACEALTLRFELSARSLFKFPIFNIWDMGFDFSESGWGDIYKILLKEPFELFVGDPMEVIRFFAIALVVMIVAAGIIYQTTKKMFVSAVMTLPLINMLLIITEGSNALIPVLYAYVAALLVLFVICIIRLFKKNNMPANLLKQEGSVENL